MNKNLLNQLVCPKSKAKLQFDKLAQELICVESELAYPVREGIPMLISSEARTLAKEELNRYSKS